ncbi:MULTISPECIES: rRNA maturation RNase YbeY [unclassified Arcicella]|uniref:rRNA maturation RNase YbeY n=1 Tax=unclassified Arcicella TaxID=2644986 RepID=UPI00285568A5|nr:MULTISPECIES: rRNA maturation RNase YbeY [unclassified Arcicella]MDR6564436.1 rRNA maturation RNase YbeY [Arcicella sp. BE51]MDR6814295.1 rRNA maturation RNase YbeY [Arcicella sp. BE140]MDR6825683.1 rRNA maturation RNase YbeY [Arcicella sp. BE139]
MIVFFNEDIDFKFSQKNQLKAWLKKVAELEGFKVGDLNYIFCSDEYLHKINVEYLDHDTYTDIITFDNSEEEEMIEGDIFVSIERVKENSQELKTEFLDEFKRVLVHGLLHLCGYDDHSDEDEAQMREIESKYISIFNS